MIFLYYDSLSYPGGGIATYLHALASYLKEQNLSFQVTVTEINHSPIIDELITKGISVYRQVRLPGDRWLIRKRAMLFWLSRKLRSGDRVFCVCPPSPSLYLPLVRLAHKCKAKIAVSWFLAPEFWPPSIAGIYAGEFSQAVNETDAVISVSKCTTHQFKEAYGYTGYVHVVPYHNLMFFRETVPLPAGPPWKIGYMGRLDMKQKNLDTLLGAFTDVLEVRRDLELHCYGDGPDRMELEEMAFNSGVHKHVYFYGTYDHRRDLPEIMNNCHFFTHPSRAEGGPCFSLLEVLQAGRFCVASRVGGIPDLYDGHPEAGLLIDPNDQKSLSSGLLAAVERTVNGSIDANAIRARYFEGFDMASAHRAWLSAIA
ncbi:MAG: glycosyltransferase [Candidatus Omnitrophica bacterium]|nr:glycosyltransferase [Candidatus Omnitrophota bacterium]